MTEKEIDITGKVCPYCLMIVRKEVGKLSAGDVLKVKCDHPPAANDTIPYNMKKEGNDIKTTLLEPGLWELIITKK